MPEHPDLVVVRATDTRRLWALVELTPAVSIWSADRGRWLTAVRTIQTLQTSIQAIGNLDMIMFCMHSNKKLVTQMGNAMRTVWFVLLIASLIDPTWGSESGAASSARMAGSPGVVELAPFRSSRGPYGPQQRPNLGEESAAIIARLPPAKANIAELSAPCENSKWQFTDQEAESAWKEYAGIDNRFASVMNILMHWARHYVDVDRLTERDRSMKSCLDAGFVTRTWQTTFGFPVTGVLSREDLRPLIPIVDRVRQQVKDTSSGAPIPSRPLKDVTEFRFGSTPAEIKTSLQPWCRLAKANEYVCDESQSPCHQLDTLVKKHESDLRKIDAKMQSLTRSIASLNQLSRAAQSRQISQVSSLEYEMRREAERQRGTADSLNSLTRQREMCDRSGSGVPRYSLLGKSLQGASFLFENGQLIVIKIFPANNHDAVAAALTARYGSPEIRDETVAERVVTGQRWEPSYCTINNTCSPYVPNGDYEPVYESRASIIKRGTWYAPQMKIVENGLGSAAPFELHPRGSRKDPGEPRRR